MPVTPVFALEQDNDWVRARIRVPFVRVSDLEWGVFEDGTRLSFFVKPYLLSLTLPGPVWDLEDADTAKDARIAKAEYDPNIENGTMVLHLPKRNPGQLFEGLDLLTKLQQPAKRKPLDKKDKEDAAGPLIEVMRSLNFEDEEGEPENVKEREPDIVKMLQKASLEDNGQKACVALPFEITYGFNNSLSRFFKDLEQDFPELVDLENPDATAQSDRRKLRLEKENVDFDVKRYIVDIEVADEDPFFTAACAFELLHSEWFADEAITFTEEEKEQMRRLRNKEFLEFSSTEQERALCSILDIVLSFLFDWRCSQGERNVESAWTVRVLSPLLSWLDEPEDPGEAVRGVVHRMVIYPYLRHVKIAEKVLKDASSVFATGKRRGILRCLLKVHDTLSHSEIYYLLNRLYITDMCIWIQQIDCAVLDEFCDRAAGCLRYYAQDIEKCFRLDLQAIERDFSGAELSE